jgi:hypothetical protein
MSKKQTLSGPSREVKAIMTVLKRAMQMNAGSLAVYGVRTAQNENISFHYVISLDESSQNILLY